MVDNNYIERIVHIPKDTFVDTKIATYLLILSKNKTSTDIIFEDKELKLEKNVTIDEIQKNDYILSVNNYVYKENIKEVIDPWQLELKARRHMLSILDNDLKNDKMICEIEGYNFNIYINQLKDIIKKYE